MIQFGELVDSIAEFLLDIADAVDSFISDWSWSVGGSDLAATHNNAGFPGLGQFCFEEWDG